MGDDPVRRDPILSKLRKLAPHRIVLELRDGETRSIMVPTKGTKWRKLGELIEAHSWTALEAFDRDGNLLGKLEAPDDEEDDEDEDVEEDRDERMARIMSKLVTDTMAQTAQIFSAQIAGQAALVTAMTEGMHQVTDAYSQALRVQSATQAAGALDGDGPATQQVLAMLGAFMMKGTGASSPPAIPAESKEHK